MEALLVYNPNAFGTAEHDAERFQEGLREAGYEPVYRATQSEDELDHVLEKARGLVVVVGGDGSLRAVVERVWKRDVPVALIPAGTANNVGRSLCLEGDPLEVVRGLAHPRKIRVDLGRMRTPARDYLFLEGGGMGLYAEALSRYQPEEGKSVLRGIKTLVDLLGEQPSRTVRLRLDGEEFEDDFLLMEAMNARAIGPRLTLSPEADMSDGLFELVRVRARDLEPYLAYLEALLNGDVPELRSVQVDRVKRFEFLWNGFPIHQDAEYEEARTDEPVWTEVEVLPGALELWLPGEDEEG